MLVERYSPKKGSETIVNKTSEVPTMNLNGSIILRVVLATGERVVVRLSGAEAKCVAALVQMNS